MKPATSSHDSTPARGDARPNSNGHYITKQQADGARKRLSAVDRRLGIVATRLDNALRIKL